jgi:dTDP-4-amino-4,6-dideoxygalactose transaminase
MPRRPWAESGCWLYSVLCRTESDAQSLVRHMADRDIEARVFWRTLSDQAPYAGTPTALSGMAARLSGTVVSLPCSSSLTPAQQARVLDALAHWPPRRRAH